MSERALDEYFLCIFIDKLVFKYDENRTTYLIERYKDIVKEFINEPAIRNQKILDEVLKEIKFGALLVHDNSFLFNLDKYIYYYLDYRRF